MTPPSMIGVGAIFIDDIVLANGQTHMGQLGGGVVHALMGAALFGERPGIVALAGQGLPQSAHDRLLANFDTTGLHQLPIPQMRAWQIFEHDGSRRELFRVEETRPFTDGAQPVHFPAAYQDSQAAYLLQDFPGIQDWRKIFHGKILWEPLQQIMKAENRQAMHDTLKTTPIDVISPNLKEARAMYGQQHSPQQLIDILLEEGAATVALRMGEEGSLLRDKDHTQYIFIPVVNDLTIRDQTGAGNCYCGTLLAALNQGHTLKDAAIMATVAASFCIEQTGALDPSVVSDWQRQERVEGLRQRANEG